jgi:hypothetical protein
MLTYADVCNQVTQLAKNNTNVWHTMLTAMPPCTRQQVGRYSVCSLYWYKSTQFARFAATNALSFLALLVHKHKY